MDIKRQLWLSLKSSSSLTSVLATQVPNLISQLSLIPLQKLREMEDIDHKRTEELRKALATT